MLSIIIIDLLWKKRRFWVHTCCRYDKFHNCVQETKLYRNRQYFRMEVVDFEALVGFQAPRLNDLLTRLIGQVFVFRTNKVDSNSILSLGCKASRVHMYLNDLRDFMQIVCLKIQTLCAWGFYMREQFLWNWKLFMWSIRIYLLAIQGFWTLPTPCAAKNIWPTDCKHRLCLKKEIKTLA